MFFILSYDVVFIFIYYAFFFSIGQRTQLNAYLLCITLFAAFRVLAFYSFLREKLFMTSQISPDRQHR
jgi:hypothetical protein